MKNNSKIFIATDSRSYYSQILNTIYLCRDKFFWENQYSNFFKYEDYQFPKTKFYKKAIISGRKPIFLVLKKI